METRLHVLDILKSMHPPRQLVQKQVIRHEGIPAGRDLAPARRQEGGGHAAQNPDGSSAVDWLSFFEVWTAKEATLKANGVGIGHLLQCRIVRRECPGRMVLSYDGKSWVAQHLSYAGHLACVAIGDPRVLWHVIDTGS